MSPRPTDAQVIAALKRAAAPGCLVVARRCQGYLLVAGEDQETVSELIADCRVEELVKHCTDNNPARQDYIAVLRMHNGTEDCYVKVALRLPDLHPGRLISFKPWVD